MITCTASLVGPRPSGSTLTGSSALQPIGKEFLSGKRSKVQLRGPVFKTVQLEYDSGARRVQDDYPIGREPCRAKLSNRHSTCLHHLSRRSVSNSRKHTHTHTHTNKHKSRHKQHTCTVLK
ncbi:unnamed protein product [Gadus morhua 'NCC']